MSTKTQTCIKRYYCDTEYGDGCGVMNCAPNGDYVKFDDFVAVTADLVAACESAFNALSNPGAKGPSIAALLTQLRAALKRAKGERG